MKKPLSPAEIIDRYMGHYTEYERVTGQHWSVPTVARHLRFVVNTYDMQFEKTLERHLNEMMPMTVAV